MAILSHAISEKIGPGRLILVVGPSGAGKDTLIRLAQKAYLGDTKIIFPRRAVTRESSVFEDNETVSPANFAQGVTRGDFALHWTAHGLNYGVSRAIDDSIRSKCTVVVNVSRTVVETARKSYANTVVILITAPSDILAQRISARARISDGSLKQRTQRDVTDPLPDIVINNVGSADDHVVKLLAAIAGL